MCVCVAVSRVRTVQRYSGVRCRGEREGGSKSEAKGKTEREHRICLTAPLRGCLRLGSTRGPRGDACGEAKRWSCCWVRSLHGTRETTEVWRTEGVVLWSERSMSEQLMQRAETAEIGEQSGWL